MGCKIFRSEQRRKPLRGVLFDMDGVLLDTEKLYTRFWQEAAIALGYPMTKEQALGMRSLNRAAGEAQLKKYLGEGADYHLIRNERIRLMDAYVAHMGVELMPGVTALLDHLDKAGILYAITTSSPIERAERYLKPLGLLDRFRAIVTGYDVPMGKPEPDIYEWGAARLGLAPEECLAIEDSDTGILSAYRAGCLAVMVPDQDAPKEETYGRLYALCDRLDDVMELIG